MFTEDYYAYEIFYMDDPIDQLQGIEFKECTFDGIDFEDTNMINCTFENCQFKACRWRGAIVTESAFLNCQFRFSTFFSTVFKQCKVIGANFEDVDLTMIDIDGGIWNYSDLRRQNFSNKTFESVDFSGSDLSTCSFKKATVTKCNLNQCRLSNSNFSEADIRGTTLERTDIKTMLFHKTKMDLDQIVLLAHAHGGNYTP